MIIPTTGIVFLFGAAVYFYLSSRFNKFYKKENNNIAKWFSFAFFSLGLNYCVEVFPTLFFITDAKIWMIIGPIHMVLLSVGFIIMVGTIAKAFSLKFFRIFIFPVLIISLGVIIMNILYPPTYFFVDGSLNWEVKPQVSIFSGLLSIIIIPTAILLFRQAKKAEDKTVKIRAMGFGLYFIFLLLTAIIDFVLMAQLKLKPVYSDLNYFLTFIILGITLIKTWGSPREKLVKKVE